jgi:hypothetical protein
MLARNAFGTKELCNRNGFSQGWLYAEWRAGRGPRFFRAGDRRFVTLEAEAEWLRQLEAAVSPARAA